MNLDNIVERRIVDRGQHKMVLELSKDEYNKVYNEYSDHIARRIVRDHLMNRDDDGRPLNVKMERPGGGNIIKIYADLSYLGNPHTSYDE